MFTGLTAEEGATDGPTTGDKLTCACATEGLTPLQWLNWDQTSLPNNDRRQLVDYSIASRQPGSAVHLRINRDGFSCAEAGEYTCVVGNNTRTVLVTPIGEYSKQCTEKALFKTFAAKVCRSVHVPHFCRPELLAPPIYSDPVPQQQRASGDKER